MKKVVFIIPGHSESTSKVAYQEIGKNFKHKGFIVKFVDISWKYKTMSDYLNEFRNEYNKYKGHLNTVLGFSFGAMIGYLTAEELKPDYLFLCSLSPYFAEDLKYILKYEKYIGKKRMKDFAQYKFNEQAKKIKSQIILFLGDKEIKEVKDRVEDASIKLKNSRLIRIEGATHNISNKNYIETVVKEIKNIEY